MADLIHDYLRRPGRYENIDGLIDMFWGLMLLGFELFDWLQQSSPPGSLWRRSGAQMVFATALILALHYGRKAIKKHVTYPRTGFIEHRKTVRRRWAPALAFVLSAVISAGAALVLRHGTRTGETLLIWLSNAVVYAVATRLDRAWKWGVLVVMTTGLVAIALAPLDRKTFEQLAMLFLGAVWVASGVITFTLYLRDTRAAEPGTE
jgi:hypothetical protein